MHPGQRQSGHDVGLEAAGVPSRYLPPARDRVLHTAAGAERRLLTVLEAAAYLGLTEKALRRRIERAKASPNRCYLPYRQVGHSLRFLSAELDAWMTQARRAVRRRVV